MTRKRLILLAAAILLLASGWYFGSPYWTLYQMREAAEGRDSGRLARYIDFPALRASTKEQVKAQLAAPAEASRRGGDGLAGLGVMLGMAMVDPLVDALITPEAMRFAFDRAPARAEAGGGGAGEGGPRAEPGGEAGASGPRAEPKQAPFGADANDGEIVRSGLDEFRLRRRGSSGESGDLIFRRHGLGWKLEEIRIPPNLLATERPDT